MSFIATTTSFSFTPSPRPLMMISSSHERLLEIIIKGLGDGVKEKEVVVAMNDIRYAGYLKDQEALARKRGRYDELEIPGSLDFARIAGLSNEVVQKLGRV